MIGMVALHESQRFDNKMQLLVYFCALVVVLRFWVNFLPENI